MAQKYIKSTRRSMSSTPTTEGRTGRDAPPFNHFQSPTDKEIYNQYYSTTVDVPVRGLIEDWEKESKYKVIFDTLYLFQWREYVAHPKGENLSIVREWFLHLHIPTSVKEDDENESTSSSTIWVRGVEIFFSPEEIQKFYKLRVVEDCNFKRLTADKGNLKMIYPTLYPFGSKSTENVIDKQHMNWLARIWQQFLNILVMPVSGSSTVSFERAVFIYCMIKKLPIDIAAIIYDSMYVLVQKRVKTTYFGAFISEFCIIDGVRVLNDEIAKPGLPFNKKNLDTFQDPVKIDFVKRGTHER